jgi:uncharacterized membrane protein
MDIALWIGAGILAAAFLMAGMMKIITPHEKLKAQMPWVEDFPSSRVKLIGLVEVLGSVGLILPPLLNVAEGVVPLAAAGLLLTMIGAFATHLRRGDPVSNKVVNFVLGGLALMVAVGRYWIEPF